MSRKIDNMGAEAYQEHVALTDFLSTKKLVKKMLVTKMATKRAEFVDQLTIQELSSGLIKDTVAEEAERGRLTIARLLEQLKQ